MHGDVDLDLVLLVTWLVNKKALQLELDDFVTVADWKLVDPGKNRVVQAD